MLILLGSIMLTGFSYGADQSTQSYPIAEQPYYRCTSYYMCNCIPRDQPGSGMTCDYFGTANGPDRSSAAASASNITLNNCEQDCTRKTGDSCRHISDDCIIVRP